jgi:hypothetical protein
MGKPLDVAQFCPECGAVLNWTKAKEHTEARPSYNARCSCFWEVFDMATPARELTATERLLLARIAELEEARRWRVTAEEMPPVGVDVVGDWGDCTWPCAVARWDGSWWHTEETASVVPPERWSPLPGVPEISQGADVPEGE